MSLRPLLAFAAALGVGACVTSTAEPTSTAADQATLTQFGGLPQAPPLFLGHDEGTDSPGLLLAPNWPSLARETGARASAETALLTTELVPDRAGAILAPVLVQSVGVSRELAIMGCAAVVITALAWPHLRRADELSAEDAATLAVIRASPMLAPLPLPSKLTGRSRVSLPSPISPSSEGSRMESGRR